MLRRALPVNGRPTTGEQGPANGPSYEALDPGSCPAQRR